MLHSSFLALLYALLLRAVEHAHGQNCRLAEEVL